MKKIIKLATMTTISMSLFFNTMPINANIGAKPTEYLKRFNTQEVVSLRGQNIQIPVDFEYNQEQFRGVWVSTVFNLDFPDKNNMSEAQYKAGYIKMLNDLENLNMNAVIFQVRPKADAFYKSDINPWSEYLTGSQGKSPNWDPMKWMIEETHKRGMEFHAWFNPYRVTTGKQSLNSLAPMNWARKNPQNTFEYEDKIYLNPGEPEVINHVTETVMEVVSNYDVDAIHFDDYFYPSRKGDANRFYTESEKNTFAKYRGNFENVSSWRRDNVDKLISNISGSIKDYNLKNGKYVEFGISPFGIWGHEANHPVNAPEGQGSKTPTSSTESYGHQFADTRKWVKNEWIDYIAPQVYWAFDTKAAPYAEITHWWADTVKDTDVNLYIGHASYKMADKNNKDNSWNNPDELLNQLKFNSMYDEIDGSIFFRYKSLLDSTENAVASNKFVGTLKSSYFNAKVDTPKNNKYVAKLEPGTSIHENKIYDVKEDISPLYLTPLKDKNK